jgi:hypothetical protein
MPGIPAGADVDATVEGLGALAPLFVVVPVLQPATSRAALPAASITNTTR